MVLVAVDVRVRVVLVALVFVAGLAWTPTLQAQAVSPATDNEEEARALFIAGRSAFDQGRFEEALSHFKRSYELSGRPELLYNIGTAADRVGRLEEAITAFRSYLEGSPDSPRRPQIEARLEVLDQQLANQRALEQRAGVAPSPEDAARAAMGRPAGPAGADLSDTDESGRSRGLTIGLVSASVVVVAVVVVLSVVLTGRESQPNYTVRGDSGNVILTLRGAP
ncbi:MAG: tetratricopeptide repeat protein [Sandaracinaceae bacterium]|nr:tetratricopeptide repeat protein [Sandaracinaceae bacterium]MBK7152888.1 tetratricopeptide repeat protein [Sandaracinaceae bacterium]MBK7777244.1 tetratricopeptide repeat protein [Sandaracinaceae bacterium]